jgi:dTDP-4-dehydrorhamnose 3,5-epimerase-like enzyme
MPLSLHQNCWKMCVVFLRTPGAAGGCHGGLYGVIIDLQPSSPAYLHRVAVELAADNRCMLLMSAFYASACACGVRWNAPTFGIRWPLQVPDFTP